MANQEENGVYTPTRLRINTEGRVMAEVEQGRFERMWAAKGIPASLIKATYDPFDYGIGLKSGLVLFFEQAWLPEIDQFAGWVHLSGIKKKSDLGQLDDMNFERGIDIRVDEIAWCADAPYGS